MTCDDIILNAVFKCNPSAVRAAVLTCPCVSSRLPWFCSFTTINRWLPCVFQATFVKARAAFYRSDVGARDCLKPDVGVRDCLEPDAGVRDCLKPDVGARDCLEPDVSVRDCLKPDVSVRDCLKPDVGVRDCLKPDVGVRDCLEPDVSVRDCLKLFYILCLTANELCQSNVLMNDVCVGWAVRCCQGLTWCLYSSTSQMR